MSSTICVPRRVWTASTTRRLLSRILAADLNFHEAVSNYASHSIHAFAAKFPPQLPRVFIEGLTDPGETMLDPMMGSGTAIVEAFLANRRAVGFDIDLLALLICRVKTMPVDFLEASWAGKRIVSYAYRLVERAGHLGATLWNGRCEGFVRGNPFLLRRNSLCLYFDRKVRWVST